MKVKTIVVIKRIKFPEKIGISTWGSIIPRNTMNTYCQYLCKEKMPKKYFDKNSITGCLSSCTGKSIEMNDNTPKTTDIRAYIEIVPRAIPVS